MVVSRAARAKVNLALHVTGRRGDGYHELDSIVGFAEVYDRIDVSRAEGLELAVDGPFAAALGHGDDNLALRAAGLLREAARAAGHDVPGARLRLQKNLPVAGGLGGGSADAAATLVALAELWRLPAGLDLVELASRLGSDVAMCLVSRPLRARGRGDRIEPLPGAAARPAVLVNPGVPVATAAVFAALVQRDHPPIGHLPADPFDPAYLEGLRNDLEAAALAIAPQIGEALGELERQRGCLLARMSGSGATCFGLFSSGEAAAEAQAAIVDTAPQWWSVATVISGSAE